MGFDELYEESLTHSGFSVFSGGEKTTGTVHFSELPKSKIIAAFLEDPDIQEITITSANIGFSRTYGKIYRTRRI